MYESDQVTANCDIPVYTDQTVLRVNRIDARFVDRGRKTVTLLETSCSWYAFRLWGLMWVENRKQKEKEKTTKYAPLRLELNRQHPGYEVRHAVQHHNRRTREYSQETSNRVRNLLDPLKGREILRRKQKAVLNSRLNIVRTFKIVYWTLKLFTDWNVVLM